MILQKYMLGFHKLCCHVGISQIMLPCFGVHKFCFQWQKERVKMYLSKTWDHSQKGVLWGLLHLVNFVINQDRTSDWYPLFLVCFFVIKLCCHVGISQIMLPCFGVHKFCFQWQKERLRMYLSKTWELALIGALSNITLRTDHSQKKVKTCRSRWLKLVDQPNSLKHSDFMVDIIQSCLLQRTCRGEGTWGI
jgi:hypothetical protein